MLGRPWGLNVWLIGSTAEENSWRRMEIKY